MKNTLLLFCFVFIFSLMKANDADTSKLYNPSANTSKDISEAIKKASEENKYVLIQAGGNWCSWCIAFNSFTIGDKQIDSSLKADFIIYHLNYSQENKNYTTFKKYGFPQRFGFPVFLILDGNGKLLHTENSAYLEKGKSYDKGKVLEFLRNWRPAATDEKFYQSDLK